ncbi:hypothetical protein [Pseudomonas maumuensis]|uniref:Uncharacterized protein n=1 Tax=Pseudomonas maumuensis TaxID=2842354 RepID=A0ABX8NEU0_9PSED|nr:hypothetical protein [Pseudomonas maumuensis]QXH54939.1 hypothetical protein KSS90_16415 [Pseudomonas maumuensis]
MSSLFPGPDATRRVRPKLFWRLLLLLVCLLAAFLYVGFISLGGYLLMLGLDGEHPEPQRYLALAGGVLILLVAAWLLKVAMPRRLVPTVVERQR